jgi:hypothetical protein
MIEVAGSSDILVSIYKTTRLQITEEKYFTSEIIIIGKTALSEPQLALEDSVSFV